MIWRAEDNPTRPEIVGTFGVVSSTHWIPSQVAMAALERGANAVDAAAAAAFVLHVAEPHMNGLGGDVVVLLRTAGADEPIVVCGQGPAPARATVAELTGRGLDVIPAVGLLPAVVPGAFDAWMLVLRDHGTHEVADVLGPAIGYARHGMPVHTGLSESLASARDRLLRDWPSSAAAFLPGGAVPAPGTLLARPELADTLERLVAAAVGPTREARIDAARAAWATGFVGEGIDEFCRAGDGLLTGDDLAAWSATYDEPAAIDHRGWRIAKARTWSQGPALLQALQLLDHLTDGVPFESGARRHAEVEALKLAFADREAWYGDPAVVDVPLDALLDPAYAAARAALVGDRASAGELRAGSPGGRTPRLPTWRVGEARTEEPIGRQVRRLHDHVVPKEGDTCHLDVIDRFGNVVAATPSGGWLQTSPVIPGLGFSLPTRGQIFWLQDGLAGTLRPGARPRTTLTPSLARGPDGEWLAFGSPGGDSQEQWCLQFLVRVLEGADLQSAIDAPSWQVDHGPGSFWPRVAPPTRVLVESRTDPAVVDDLRARGHRVEITAPWELGRTCAALRQPDGILRAAASPRRLQAYAVGR